MALDLNEILVFARVVQAGSFIAASAQLGMPKSTVSRKVSDLETRLNARLLQRTTRKLSLTDVGRTYYDYCARIVGEVEDAERAVSSLQDKPRGPLRVTAGPNVSFLTPILSDYLKRHPEVRLELVTTTRAVDLVEERFDLGIRAGTLADSTLVARTLGRVGWFLVATPAYLKKRGRPRSPEELARHDFVFFGAGLEGVGPRLEKDGRTVHVALSPRLSATDMDVVHGVAAAGLGIALLPAFQCVEELRDGRLARVLPDWNAPSVQVHVVYPSTRHVSPKVKTFVEHLLARMSPPPWELGPMP
ncbi:Transcriptional regulator, LysR family [Labilithrix luteola]|uniref:Transcriptional regulator, LysR family n=1 Tax=Labilithrix luteola TaxID=1391654 RepID=A0A0K1PQP4_9BACT|nr:Transcriptional regulator, LysR family [Labilithrix luteola]